MKRAALAALVIGALVCALTAWRSATSERMAKPKDGSIVIKIEHSRFIPSTVAVEPGSTVRFVIENTDPIDHEFILGDLVLQTLHEQGTGRHNGSVPGEISVPAGWTRSTTYTLPETSPALLFGCHVPGHWAFGMRGTVTFA
jgi:uncharacterized cupredoxin-like copper-binding protein